jgi:RHS repeat-associated protein
MAKVNPFRFSTKYQDDETDIIMYPLRPYNPSTGRFLCKDPIQERGGLNLYAFVGNDPIDRIDPLGLVIVNLKYQAYIETPTVTFLGQTFNGGVKIRHSINVDTDAASLIEVEKYIGHTIEYAYPGGPVTGEGQATGSTVKASIDARGPSRGSGDSWFRVKMSGDESNPLVSGAPGITYEVFIYFYKCSRKISWTGTHDRFPSHDFFEKGKLVHHFSHVTAGTTPASLFPTARSEHFDGEDTY